MGRGVLLILAQRADVSLAAMLELGALVGALLAGVLADRFSRKTSILVACGESTFYSGFGFCAVSMMFEAFGFSRGAPCIAENYLSYLRAGRFGGYARFD